MWLLSDIIVMTVKHIFPPEFITVILKGDTVISLHRILQLKK